MLRTYQQDIHTITQTGRVSARASYPERFPWKAYWKVLRLKDQSSVVIALAFGFMDTHRLIGLLVWKIIVGVVLIGSAACTLNDFFDARDTDALNKRFKEIPVLQLSRKVVLIHVAAFYILGNCLLIASGQWICSLLLSVLTLAYSIPPFRLKATLLGAVINMSAGMGAYLVAYYSNQSGQVAFPFTHALTYFCMLLVIVSAIDMRDVTADRAAGLSNLGALLGHRNLMYIIIVGGICALLGVIKVGWTEHWWLIVPGIFTPMAYWVIKNLPSGWHDPEKWESLFSRLTAVTFPMLTAVSALMLIVSSTPSLAMFR